ncbi:DUF1203 domain-containing protein [Streptomyces sp. XD-27]|uniref:DUF1203 domain-containing protein n=1 Tax=Streptomyces sp. XD-27 TaxID=3062779 RepID=UPI0026F449C5|nr:DUF1203 domain-containing protein [Streptomyces sp. XD-27]WKX73308.1 DUF1203 domain-containing protein [Streptomyces sp. XD-27]
MSDNDYEIRAIAPAVLKQLRERDDAGNAPQPYVDEEGGAPLRCCLRRGTPGEKIALASYAPLRRWARETGARPGPYDEVGPVFIHPAECDGWAGSRFPEVMHGDRRVLRAYSADGRILGGRLLDGDTVTVDEALAEVYADPEVAAVHVRFVEFGCFLLETRRLR